MTIDMDVEFKIGNTPIPIEERLKKYEPLCDGLYPHEVLLLHRAPNYTNKTERFTVDWEYTYGIKDVPNLLVSLVDRGYLRIGSLEESMDIYKAQIIKEQLKKRGLKVSGKKADLVQRLFDNVPLDELEAFFDERPYRLTPQGEDILKKHEWVPYVVKKFTGTIDIWEFSILMAAPPQTDYKDKIWDYLYKRCSLLQKKNQYGYLRNDILTLSQLAHDNGDYSKAFDFLCVVTAYDLSCVDNSFKLDMFNICLSSDLYYDYRPNSSYRVSEYFSKKYREYMEIFDWTEDELREHIVTNISNVNLPIRLFTPEECGDIVIAEIEKDTNRLTHIYSAAKQAFRNANKEIFKEIEELDKDW